MLWESREEAMLVFPSSITIIHSFKKNVLHAFWESVTVLCDRHWWKHSFLFSRPTSQAEEPSQESGNGVVEFGRL